VEPASTINLICRIILCKSTQIQVTTHIFLSFAPNLKLKTQTK